MMGLAFGLVAASVVFWCYAAIHDTHRALERKRLEEEGE